MVEGWGEGIKLEVGRLLKLKNGDNDLRIGGKPKQVKLHWEKTFSNNIKKIICPGEASCPLCKNKSKIDSRYYFPVISRDNDQASILECGSMIMEELLKYAKSPNYGNPMCYDVRISKSGEDRSSKYTVLARKNKSDITADERELLDKVDISSYLTPTKVEDIWAMGLAALPINLIDEEPSNNSVDVNDDWTNL